MKIDYEIVEDRTIEEIKKIIVQKYNNQTPRDYIGASILGGECTRQVWYDIRNATPPSFEINSILAIEDGYTQEEVMSRRLSLLPGIKLYTRDEETENQITIQYKEIKGHVDGVICGLKESKKWHVWEHKSVNEKKYNILKNLKIQDAENALEKWDYKYYVQAQIYMEGLDIDRHFLTVSTPGGRDFMSLRTKRKKSFMRVVDNLLEIVKDDNPPGKISDKPEFYLCKWCRHKKICHDLKGEKNE